MGLITDAAHPDTLLIHHQRPGRAPLRSVTGSTSRPGALKLDTQNPGDVAQFYADHRLRVRAAYVTKPDNSVEIRVARRHRGSRGGRLIAWGADEMNSDDTGVAGFTADDSEIWIITSLGRQRRAPAGGGPEYGRDEGRERGSPIRCHRTHGQSAPTITLEAVGVREGADDLDLL
ncbi:MAG: hypothetical protein MZW92_03360 [Comamonadaceae bacterium]|nr:hypothetical protein [Comamonadaceae bacterium]